MQIESALQQAYLACDDAFLASLADEPNVRSKRGFINAGACALLVVIRGAHAHHRRLRVLHIVARSHNMHCSAGWDVVTANVGDCRAIVVSTASAARSAQHMFSATALTEDHNCINKAETTAVAARCCDPCPIRSSTSDKVRQPGCLRAPSCTAAHGS